MKLKNDNNIVIEESDDSSFETINAGIDNDNVGLMAVMMSKNLYSNPIESIIREVTSNAVDANTDNDITDPVIVKIYKDSDELHWLEIIDKGLGISPEKFKNIFMNWFSSDKRDTNKKIGGWGQLLPIFN